MKRLILICLIVFAAVSCAEDSKSISAPAERETIHSNESVESEVDKENAVNLGLGHVTDTNDKLDDSTKKLHDFADNKCKCGQKAFKNIGDIDLLTESQIKEVRTMYKNCIGEFRTGEIIKIMDKNIVDNYMTQNCPQISSTFNRLKNRL